MKLYQHVPSLVSRKPLTPPRSTPVAKASPFASYAAIRAISQLAQDLARP
uniref:Uncharacterized protein n=1 Tax=Hyaloperonospora arabidopsidis (strain Emoy2) TaxID=559515 RepID=M4C3J6_HYAAE